MTGVELRLVSFNIRYGTARDGRHSWPLRRQVVAELMRTMQWDVLGVQELLVGQRRYLERQLPGTRWYGVGRSDGYEAGEQSALVVRGPWTVLDWETRWLSSAPDAVGSKGWDARITRVATIARLTHPGTRRTVGVVATHFDHAGTVARTESAQLIAGWVAAEPDIAWVVLGDLNCTPGSPPLSVLEAAGLRHALPGEAGGTEHAWTGRTDRKRIDHILIDASYDVFAGGVDHARPRGVLPSDHWPVWAHLRLSA